MHPVKYLIVLVVGIIETYFSTNWALFAIERKAIASSIMMFLFILINLIIVSWAIKGDDTLGMVIAYAISAGIGNYISIKCDIKKHEGDKCL